MRIVTWKEYSLSDFGYSGEWVIKLTKGSTLYRVYNSTSLKLPNFIRRTSEISWYINAAQEDIKENTELLYRKVTEGDNLHFAKTEDWKDCIIIWKDWSKAHSFYRWNLNWPIYVTKWWNFFDTENYPDWLVWMGYGNASYCDDNKFLVWDSFSKSSTETEWLTIKDLKKKKINAHLLHVEMRSNWVMGYIALGENLDKIDKKWWVDYVVFWDEPVKWWKKVRPLWAAYPDVIANKCYRDGLSDTDEFRIIPITKEEPKDFKKAYLQLVSQVQVLEKDITSIQLDRKKSIESLENQRKRDNERWSKACDDKFEEWKKEGEKKAKAALMKKAPTKKKKEWRHKAWDDVIIEDNNYKTMQVCFDKKMPMLIKWPSWVGKSSMVRALCNEKGLEMYQFPFNGETTVEHLLWHKILVGQSKKSDDPMKFEYWPLAHAVKYGWIFLADEINTAPVEVQFILNGLLENKNWELGSLTVQSNNWEVIKPHPNFRFYWTYNPWYLGTKTFGMSMMSRMVSIEVKHLDNDDEIALLTKKFPNNVAEIKLLVDIETQLRSSKNFNYDVSTRDIEQALMFIESWFSVKDAIDATIKNCCQLDVDLKTIGDIIDKMTKE